MSSDQVLAASSRLVIEVQWIETMYPVVFAQLNRMDKRQRAEQVRAWCQSAVLAKQIDASTLERVSSRDVIGDRQRDQRTLPNESPRASQGVSAMDAPDDVFNLLR